MAGFYISFNWPDWPNIAFAILCYAIAFLVRQRYHRRAMAKDHVAEVSRDVAIPWECVGCASSDAPFRFGVESKVALRMISMTTPFFEMSKTFWFHFCLRCSRVLRRRRRFGSVVILAGVCVLLFIPVSVVVLKASDAAVRLVNAGPADWYLFALICAALAFPLVIATGITIYDSAPPVSVVDAGGSTIFFAFRNQQFRDSFARLNGED